MQLVQLIPEPEVVCALEPNELGLRMLPVLAAWLQVPTHNQEIALSDAISLAVLGEYPPAKTANVVTAVREAWAWLEGAALLMEHPNYPVGGRFRALSRVARQLAKEPEPHRAYSARRIPKESLHLAIREDVWALYHRGKYDTAVFEAMKAVEVAVREAAALSPRDLGTDLMRTAFNPENGPLTDMASEKPEREARAHLFAGVIGSYKNPHSHRRVELDDPDEAAEIIMIANHLLRIVDTRRAGKA